MKLCFLLGLSSLYGKILHEDYQAFHTDVHQSNPSEPAEGLHIPFASVLRPIEQHQCSKEQVASALAEHYYQMLS